MRENVVKRKLRAGGTVFGTWLSLGDVHAARFLARMGFDWLTVDAEHAPIGPRPLADLIAAVADGGGTPLVRVPCLAHAQIKHALDFGGFGVVVPMVMDAEEAAAAVSACRYPPAGSRSVGGSLHALAFGATPADYYRRANDEILIVLQCEHPAAAAKLDDILAVPGIDAIFVGPNDLRANMRTPDGADPSPEAFEAMLTVIREACDRHGVAPGLHVFSAADAVRRVAEGWRFLAVGSDLSMMLAAAKDNCQAIGLKTREVARY